jgi:hypothetical protein
MLIDLGYFSDRDATFSVYYLKLSIIEDWLTEE